MKMIANFKNAMLVLVTILSVGFNASAEESTTAPADGATSAPTETSTETKVLTWNELIQKKYNLTEAQAKTLADAKLNEAQSVRVAHMAQLSNKSIEDVLKMRTEQKLGWGQIAKQLNVPESEIGKAVSSLRKERNDLRQQANEEKRKKEKEAREAKREENRKKAEEKRAQAEAKRLEREAARKEKQEARQAKKSERKDSPKGRDRK